MVTKEQLAKHVDVMRMVQADCEADARALDSTPFTPHGLGTALGQVLAQIKAVAKTCEVLAEQLQ
jgi:hypothetical protein